MLTTIINNTFYVAPSRQVNELLICVDNDGSFNESWPEKWYRMDKYGRFFSLSALNECFTYKLSYIDKSRQHKISEWTLSDGCFNFIIYKYLFIIFNVILLSILSVYVNVKIVEKVNNKKSVNMYLICFISTHQIYLSKNYEIYLILTI